ncbi:MAG: O-antigen ligase family protein, partial [Hyphomicrobiaceae bacterium]
IAVLVMVLGLATLEVFNPRALRILEQFLMGGGQVKTLVARELLWDYSLDQFLKDPVLGEGAGQKLNLWYKEIKEQIPHSHNVIADYMRSLGFPGLAAISLVLLTSYCVFFSTIILAYQARLSDVSHRLTAVGLCIGGGSYIFANMSSDSFGPTTSPFFWIVVYMAVFMRRGIRHGIPICDR